MSLFIETINKLDKRWYLLLLFILVVLLIAGTIFFFQFQEQQKVISLEKSISTLKMQAIKAEYDGELDKADSLYTKALDDAFDSEYPMKVIEIFSRLVQIKIKNNKIRQADPLMQKAIKLALFIKGTDASDSNMDVWMDDMANAYYKRGEHSTSEVVKEYCMRHYLDIKLPLEDRSDEFLAARAGLFLSYLRHNDRALEESIYREKLCHFYIQTGSNGNKKANDDPGIHHFLAPMFAERKQFEQAENELKQWAEFSNWPSQTKEINLSWEVGHLREATGDLQAAKTLYQKVVDADRNEQTEEIGLHKNVLGFVEQRLGNLNTAANLYKASLTCFDHCHPAKFNPAIQYFHPEGPCYSGQVFAAEHLAQIELKQGNLSLARSLQARAEKIRAQNSYWATVKYKDLDSFYIVNGFFPFQIDFLPTHFSLADIKQN